MPLRNNFLWNTIGYSSNAIFQWSILVILAKSNQVEMIGHYALALSISTPISMFCWLSLRSILASDLSNQYSFNTYISLRIIMVIVGYSIIGLVVLFTSYSYVQTALILILGLTKVFDGISDIYLGYYQQHGRSYILGQSLSMKSLLSITLFILSMMYTSNILIASLSTTLVSIGMIFLFDTKFVGLEEKYSIFNFQKSKIIGLLILSFPLGSVTFLYALSLSIPRFFVEKYLGIKSVGFYVSIYSFVMAGIIFAIALTDAILPVMTKFMLNYQRQKLEKLLITAILISTFTIIIGLVIVKYFGASLLTITFNSEYAKYENLLIMGTIMLGTEVITKLISNTLTVFREIKVQTLLSLFNIVFMFIACYFLIPNYGMNGAFIGQTIVNLFQITLSVMILYRTFNKWFNAGII